jgi:tetratricopeptide (TPR) repeat protein
MSLSFRFIPAVTRTRYCARCRRDWPVETESCPECLLWLGEATRLHRFFWVDLAPAAPAQPRDATARPRWINVLALSVAISLRREPDEAERALLTGYLAKLVEMLAGYGGLIARPDRSDVGLLTAVFPDTLGSEGSLGDGLAAALQMRNASRPPASLNTLSIECRIALNVGPVLLQDQTAPARVRGGVVGRALELARAAPAGVILATQAVFRRAVDTHDLFAVGLPGLRSADGPVFALEGPKRPTSHRSQERHEGPAVGRERELMMLREALLALRAARGARLSLIAEPGVGKTRLIASWLQCSAASGLLDGIVVCEGMGASYASSAGWVLRSVLESWSRGRDTTELPQLLASLDLSAEARATLAALTEGRSIPLSRLSRAFGDFLAAVRGPAGLILVLDDVHWIDDLSLRALETLLTDAPAAPCLIVLAFRPSAAPRLAALIHHSDLVCRLAPLTAAACESLLRLRLGAGKLPPGLGARLAAQARGNPLYVEEALGLLLDTGRLTRNGEDWELSAPVDHLMLPGGVAQVILARVEHLAETEVTSVRQRQQVVGMTGSGYDPRWLIADIERIEGKIGAWLDRLETVDVPDQMTISRSLRRLESIEFDLLLTRMLLGRPRPRNARLAAAIERLEEGSLDAYRRSLAERLDGGDRGQVVNEARSAAERASLRRDYASAASFYRLALAALDDGASPARPGVLRDLISAELLAGDLDSARSHIGLALGIAEGVQQMAYELDLAEVAMAQGDLNAATQWLPMAAAHPFAKSSSQRDRYVVLMAELAERRGEPARVRYWSGRFPWHCAVPWLAVRAAMALAAAALSEGRNQAAQRWLWRAIDLLPDDAQPGICRRLAEMIDAARLASSAASMHDDRPARVQDEAKSRPSVQL